MPLYEYHCDDCQASFELLVRSSDERIECPECSSPKIAKELSIPAAPSMQGSLPIQHATSDVQPGMCGRSQCQMGGCMNDW